MSFLLCVTLYNACFLVLHGQILLHNFFLCNALYLLPSFVFGHACFIYLLSLDRGKFIKFIFLGYSHCLLHIRGINAATLSYNEPLCVQIWYTESTLFFSIVLPMSESMNLLSVPTSLLVPSPPSSLSSCSYSSMTPFSSSTIASPVSSHCFGYCFHLLLFRKVSTNA